MDLHVFTPIVKSLTKKFTNSIRNMDGEDVSQELIVKLLEIMPKLQELSLTDARKLCRACLSRHAIDLYKRERRCGNTSSTYGEETVTFLQIDPEICKIVGITIDSIISEYESPEKYFEVKELKSAIVEWAKKQKKDICTLVTEFIDPSPETTEAYFALCKNINDIDYISPWILARALKISDRTWLKARVELRRFISDLEVINQSHAFHPKT